MSSVGAQASPNWRQSGVTGSGIVGSAPSFSTWRGAPVSVVSNYLGRQTWTDISHPTGVAAWAGLGYHLVWSVPMLPASGATIKIGATGAYNSYFTSLAQTLVANQQGNADLRLGWEMNGGWYPWAGFNDPSSYVGYWRQIVTAMRAVPGAAFTFNWSPSNLAAHLPDPDYPGDGYVDTIGESTYDQVYDQVLPTPRSRWNEIYNGTRGLAWLSTFSKTHGKPIGIAEWGLADRCDGHGGGDDTAYIQNMYNYFASNNMAYEAYYNYDPSTCERHALADGKFPKSAALYQKLWSSPGSKPLPANPIYLSRSPDRSNPVLLTGQITAGPVYIYVTSPLQAVRVYFQLDKAKTGSLQRLESTPPWDFAGGPPTAPTPFDLNTLKSGVHTMKVTITPPSGVTITLSSTFTLVKPR
jgi:hypothetical protein